MRYDIIYSTNKSGSITLKFTIDDSEKYIVYFDENENIDKIKKNNRIVTDKNKPIVIDTCISINKNKYDIIECINKYGAKSYLIFDSWGQLRQYLTDNMNMLYNPEANRERTSAKVLSVLNNSLAFFCERYDGSCPNMIGINGKVYNLI